MAERVKALVTHKKKTHKRNSSAPGKKSGSGAIILDNDNPALTNKSMALSTESEDSSSDEALIYTMEFLGGIYSGEINEKSGEKIPHGSGTLTWEDEGDTYHGDFKMGEMEGKGEYVCNNGDVYKGDFKNGLPHGWGCYKWPNGNIYQGEYKQGKANGIGIFIWSDCDIYEGSFKDDIAHGFGLFRYSDGSVYEGGYKEGKLHGTGTYRWFNGAIYQGGFVEGKFEGQGEFRYAPEDYKQRELYIGEWKDGVKNGLGKMTYINGKVEEGEWKKDDFIRSCEIKAVFGRKRSASSGSKKKKKKGSSLRGISSSSAISQDKKKKRLGLSSHTFDGSTIDKSNTVIGIESQKKPASGSGGSLQMVKDESRSFTSQSDGALRDVEATTELYIFLQQLKLTKYAKLIILKEELTLEQLFHCTDKDLKDIGIPLGPRKTIFDRLHTLAHSSDQYDSTSSSSSISSSPNPSVLRGTSAAHLRYGSKILEDISSHIPPSTTSDLYRLVKVNPKPDDDASKEPLLLLLQPTNHS